MEAMMRLSLLLVAVLVLLGLLGVGAREGLWAVGKSNLPASVGRGWWGKRVEVWDGMGHGREVRRLGEEKME